MDVIVDDKTGLLSGPYRVPIDDPSVSGLHGETDRVTRSDQLLQPSPLIVILPDWTGKKLTVVA
jgi:hypothetical protein